MQIESYDLLFCADEFIHKGVIEKLWGKFTCLKVEGTNVFVSFSSDKARMDCLNSIKGHVKFVAPVEYELSEEARKSPVLSELKRHLITFIKGA